MALRDLRRLFVRLHVALKVASLRAAAPAAKASEPPAYPPEPTRLRTPWDDASAVILCGFAEPTDCCRSRSRSIGATTDMRGDGLHHRGPSSSVSIVVVVSTLERSRRSRVHRMFNPPTVVRMGEVARVPAHFGHSQPPERARKAARAAVLGSRSARPTSITADLGPRRTRRTRASQASRCTVAAGTAPAYSRTPPAPCSSRGCRSDAGPVGRARTHECKRGNVRPRIRMLPP
jgi:hypothetical protein